MHKSAAGVEIVYSIGDVSHHTLCIQMLLTEMPGKTSLLTVLLQQHNVAVSVRNVIIKVHHIGVFQAFESFHLTLQGGFYTFRHAQRPSNMDCLA